MAPPTSAETIDTRSMTSHGGMPGPGPGVGDGLLGTLVSPATTVVPTALRKCQLPKVQATPSPEVAVNACIVVRVQGHGPIRPGRVVLHIGEQGV
jgi:hypothetical protein